MAKKRNMSFCDVVDMYIDDMKSYGILKNSSANNYRSRLNAVESWNGGISIDWIEKAFSENDPIGDVAKSFDSFKQKDPNAGIGITSNHRSNFLSFAKWLIGQYQANVWLSLDEKIDLEFCQMIAKNALFCAIDVAEDVKNGKIGCKGHLPSPTYSWFDNKYKRISDRDKYGGFKIGETTRSFKPILDISPSRIKIGDNIRYVTLDNNSKANQAIKCAVAKSLPLKGKFVDYEACHIWDKTCYDEKYHTSVFNLVLVPRSIAGLTDHNDAVKKMLQYESARRFGVYPSICNTPPQKPKNFDKITIWRQQAEHNNAPHTTFTGV